MIYVIRLSSEAGEILKHLPQHTHTHRGRFIKFIKQKIHSIIQKKNFYKRQFYVTELI